MAIISFGADEIIDKDDYLFGLNFWAVDLTLDVYCKETFNGEVYEANRKTKWYDLPLLWENKRDCTNITLDFALGVDGLSFSMKNHSVEFIHMTITQKYDNYVGVWKTELPIDCYDFVFELIEILGEDCIEC